MAASFTQAQLDALEEAIALGALKVQYKDKMVEYRSLTDMLRVRDLMRQALGAATAGAGRVYPRVSKGLGGDCEE